MSRRRQAEKRVILPDHKFGDIMVARMINIIMYSGKKATAEKIVYKTFRIIRDRGKDPLAVFHQAIENVSPILEVRPRRVGGATYQVPVEVSQDRSKSLALRWIRDAARKNPGNLMTDSLANELIDASSNKGLARKKREENHRLAESNRAFAHYRW